MPRRVLPVDDGDPVDGASAGGVGKVGASGVTPTTWNISTAPDVAAAAAMALSSSSALGRPVSTGTAVPTAAHDDPEQMGEDGSASLASVSSSRSSWVARRPRRCAGRPRHLADDRAHIKQVAVLVGAGTEHRVEEGDGVRFRADDLRADRRAGSGLVIRRARPHRRASQSFVDLHQPSRTLNRFGSQPPVASGADDVDQARIRVCGHGERRPRRVGTRRSRAQADRCSGRTRCERTRSERTRWPPTFRQQRRACVASCSALPRCRRVAPIEVVDLDARHGLSCAGRGSRCCRRQR